MDSLSILIPIYNFDCRELVEKLHTQCELLEINYEIICIDDASTLFVTKNASIINLSNVKFIRLGNNIGRSKIRNLLAENARSEYLLFMDCDSMIDDGFITKYIDNIGDIVVGGHIYYDTPPVDKQYYLHWKYGHTREPKPLDKNRHFTTVNFLINSKLFHEIRFDEHIKGYGHEDTVFGIALKSKDICIIYIYNPVYHIGLNSNIKFINNSRHAIENLKQMVSDDNGYYLEEVKILKYYKIIRTFGITFLFTSAYKLMWRNMEANLLGKEPSIFIFNVYKLCYLCSLK